MGAWVAGWMGGSVGQWVGSGHINKYWINLDLIKIIQFCLKIYDLLRNPHLWVDGYVNGWAHVKSLKSNKSWPDRDNSIMDIFGHFLDILLKPPQPFIGLFLKYMHSILQQIEEFYFPDRPGCLLHRTNSKCSWLLQIEIWHKCHR